MPNIYEQETRTELHKIQTKLNQAEAKIEDMETEKIKELKRDRWFNISIGSLFIIGDLTLNWLIPRLIGTSLSMNINPHIGPLDYFVIGWGVIMIVRGVVNK